MQIGGALGEANSYRAVGQTEHFVVFVPGSLEANAKR
jgi:hypothetical protein